MLRLLSLVLLRHVGRGCQDSRLRLHGGGCSTCRGRGRRSSDGGAVKAPGGPTAPSRGGGGHPLLHHLHLRQQMRRGMEVAARFPHTLALYKIHADRDRVVSRVNGHIVRRMRVAALAGLASTHAPLRLTTYL